MKKIFITTLIVSLFLSFGLWPAEKTHAQTQIDHQKRNELLNRIAELQHILSMLQAQAGVPLPSLPSVETQPPRVPFEQCTRITISWQKVPGAEFYKVFRDGAEIYRGSETSFTDSEVTKGRIYSYQLVAGNQAGESAKSQPIVRLATDPCPPYPPTNFSAQTGECGGKIKLSWDRALGAVNYEVTRGRNLVYRGNATSFVETDLTPGRSSGYNLTAIGATGLKTEFPETVSAEASDICPPETPQFTPTIVEEGFFTTNLSSFPSDSNSFKLDTNNRNIIRFGVKAHDSDMTVNRLDISFDKRPWLYFDRIRIRAGLSTILDITPTQEDFTQLSNNNFRLRVSGLNIDIREDRTRNFEVRVDSKMAIPGGTPQTFRVYLPNNAIRGVDVGGLMNLSPSSGGGIDGDFSRKFTVTGP